MLKHNFTTYLTVSLMFFHLIGLDVCTNIFFALLAIYSFIDKEKLSKLNDIFHSTKFWILISPFLLFALSFLYTTNINEGYKLLELRLSLLLIPLIYTINPLTKSQKETILKFFIIIVATLPVIGFIFNIPNYINTSDSGYFYNDNLVLIFNKQATYFGMYINFALICLFYFWHQNLLNDKTKKIGTIITVTLLLTAQYLLASRTAMAITFVSFISFLIFIGTTKIGKKKAFVLLLSFGILLTSLIVFFPKVGKRLKSIKHIEYKFDNPNQINHFNGEIKNKNWNGLNTRLAIWNCAWNEVKKAPVIGSGIGSQQENLIRNYKSKNFNFAINSNYNSHNQYLDILLSNGFIGLLVFLLFIGYLFINAIRTNNWLLLGIVLVFLTSCLTENILSRNQGVIIVWLILSLTFYSKNINQKEINS